MALKKINTCDIYVGLYLVYMMQGFLYSVGPVNKLIQLILLFMAGKAAIKYLSVSNTKRPLFKATIWLLIMYIIYGMIYILTSDFVSTSFIYIQNALNSLLPIFMFYDYSKNNYLDENRVRLYLIGFLIAFFFRSLYQQQLVLEEFAAEAEALGGMTNNSGYLYVSLIPFLFFYKDKPLLQYALLILVLALTISSMKRGAILITAIETIILVSAFIKNPKKRRQKILIAIITGCAIIYGMSYVSSFISDNDYVALRIEQTKEHNTSNRDVIYNKIEAELINEDSPIKIIFGRGAYSTVKVAGNMAHQDWLETACNNGIVGVFILAAFFIAFYQSLRKGKRTLNRDHYLAYLCIFLAVFIKTMFSMSIMDMEASITMLIGFFYFKVTEPRFPLQDYTKLEQS